MMIEVIIGVLSLLLGVIFSMAGFYLLQVSKYVSKEEVFTMIESYNKPFIEKQNLTDYRLNELKTNEAKMADVIEKSNEAINQLNLEVAKLSHVLISLESRLKKNV
jgi:uncharacterized coiled-coil protein SlyX